MSTTDEKRREVAQELRDLAAEDLDDGEFYDCGEVEDALGLVTDDGSWYAADGVRRLARLIEPEPERTCHAITTAKPFSQTHELHVKSCSSCGYIFESEAHRRMPPYYGEMGAIRATTLPNYCQCCGAEVER